MKELSLNNCRLDKRYDVVEQLGRGSYAEIYLARDILASTHSPHSMVVIKALNVFLQNDLDAELERTLIENFQNEAVALDRVRHPNIISRVGHGTARDLNGTVFHYLVIEYLSGGDLQGLIRRQDISLPQALSYVEQICAGLGHAHARGIMHRDIKPQNLLLTADLKTVKIADFGVARVSAADSPITRVGTNIYAPPEHSPMSAGRTGELNQKLTPSADIYSLAKSIYTLLTSESPRQFANSQITSLPESAMDEEWAAELLRVLRRATQDDPTRRHLSVEEFWSDLGGLRKLAADAEFVTPLTPDPIAGPQPHVSRGYSPIAPAMPSFESLSDLPFLSQTQQGNGTLPKRADISVKDDHAVDGSRLSIDIDGYVPPAGKRSRARSIAVFVIVASLFTGILYGTATYMRGRDILSGITNPFDRVVTAVANTDIYLRPEPNTNNEPIGLVTKNSKVRIVNTENNWYQVDVVQQGRIRPSQVNATRGWLNGKYLDVSDN